MPSRKLINHMIRKDNLDLNTKNKKLHWFPERQMISREERSEQDIGFCIVFIRVFQSLLQNLTVWQLCNVDKQNKANSVLILSQVSLKSLYIDFNTVLKWAADSSCLECSKSILKEMLRSTWFGANGPKHAKPQIFCLMSVCSTCFLHKNEYLSVRLSWIKQHCDPQHLSGTNCSVIFCSKIF